MGRPRATYALDEHNAAMDAGGKWVFFSYEATDESAPHVAKVVRWLRQEGLEVRSLNLDTQHLIAVRKKER